MGKRAMNNFKKRFGDPPRITVTFVKGTPEEVREVSERTFSAYKDMLTSLLGRIPTNDELYGRVPIPEIHKKITKVVEPSADYQI